MTIHALLIGINAYPTAPLHGCINDLLAVDQFFKKFCEKNGLRWNPRHLLAPHETDRAAIAAAGISHFEVPEREKIIASFGHFQGPGIEDGDVFLFYYSGHGSKEPADEAFAHLKSDGMNETIVCADSRQPGGRDLVDKELAFLLWQASRKKPERHFLVIMDCCHAGNNTRGDDENPVVSRDMVPRHAPTPFSQLLGAKNLRDTDGTAFFTFKNGRANYHEEARYVHLAASRDHETAKELNLDCQRRGAFSWSLLRVLEQGGTSVSYREIMRRTESLVRNRVREQVPLLEATDKMLENQSFLGKNLPAQLPEFPVRFVAGEWRVLAGRLQKIEPGSQKVPLQFKLKTADGAETLLTAKSVEADFTVLENEALANFSPTATDLRATVFQMPAPKIFIEIGRKIPAEKQAELREAIARAENFYTDFLSENRGENRPAEFFVEFDGASFMLMRQGGSSLPVFLRQQMAGDFVAFCEAVGKWRATLEMQNPQTKIGRDDLEIEVETIEGEWVTPQTLNDLRGKTVADPGAVQLNYRYENGQWLAPAFRCKVRVKKEGLWVGGLYLSSRFGVDDYMVPRPLPVGQENSFKFSLNGTLFNAVPVNMDEQAALGVTEITDHLKIFVSNTPFGLSDFRQADLPLDAGRMRSAGFGNFAAPVRADWTVVDIPLKIVRPASPGATPGFSLAKPLGFFAKILMSSVADVRRKMENSTFARGTDEQIEFEKLVLPPTSIWGKTVAEDDVFGRNVESGADSSLSIMEMTEVSGGLSAPILIKLDQPLGEDSLILPFGYDPETKLYIPLGMMNDAGEIEIHTLPPETPGLIHGPENFDERDFKSSVKLFFKKLFRGKPENVLFLVRPDLSFEKDPQIVRELLAKKKEILLLTHGIFGDTADKQIAVMQSTDIHRQFGAVLAFDYENLNTDLRDTARDLLERLRNVGLCQPGAPMLTIIGSSMGGLVSRWMIEKEGAAPFVRHLLMVGVPNLGSDLAVFKQRLFGLLGRAVNGISLLKPYIFPISLLLKKGDKAFFKTLMQLHPTESEFLQQLNAPGRPVPTTKYSLLGGNTDDILALPAASSNFWQRMKFFIKKRGKYTLVNALIFDGPNDMCVEVESQKGVPWLRDANVLILPIDHVGYFVEESGCAGLEKMMKVEVA